MRRIAIQGEIGSYHDVASHCYFENEDIELICCDTFEQVFDEMKQDSSVIGMVAIENTIAGSLLHNYELMRESGMQIVGEHKLRISHSIMCLPEDDWEDITEVNSHPVALMQCRDFLKKHAGLKIVETDDTAGSAKNISENGLRGHAAICSKFAAPLYGMKILEEGIETNKHNFTRFLVVDDSIEVDLSTVNKSSICFTLPHKPGSLAHILTILSFYDMNLSRIQSLPIPGEKWQYFFYVDITFDDYQRYLQALSAVRPLVEGLDIMGEYYSVL